VNHAGPLCAEQRGMNSVQHLSRSCDVIAITEGGHLTISIFPTPRGGEICLTQTFASYRAPVFTS